MHATPPLSAPIARLVDASPACAAVESGCAWIIMGHCSPVLLHLHGLPVVNALCVFRFRRRVLAGCRCPTERLDSRERSPPSSASWTLGPAPSKRIRFAIQHSAPQSNSWTPSTLPLPASIAGARFPTQSASHLFSLFLFYPPLVANQSLSGAHKNIQTQRAQIFTSHFDSHRDQAKPITRAQSFDNAEFAVCGRIYVTTARHMRVVRTRAMPDIDRSRIRCKKKK